MGRQPALTNEKSEGKCERRGGGQANHPPPETGTGNYPCVHSIIKEKRAGHESGGPGLPGGLGGVKKILSGGLTTGRSASS